MRVSGLILAAGAGSRFGGPKGLACTDSGEPWVARAVRMLITAGCDDVWVAVGARAGDVAALVPPDVQVVRVADWATGLSATLRAGIRAVEDTAADAVLITPVDTPDAPPEAAARVLSAANAYPHATLAQAMYRGAAGHPVLVGRDHFAPLAAAVTGDQGARAYLRANGVTDVECADLWSGADIDHR